MVDRVTVAVGSRPGVGSWVQVVIGRVPVASVSVVGVGQGSSDWWEWLGCRLPVAVIMKPGSHGWGQWLGGRVLVVVGWVQGAIDCRRGLMGQDGACGLRRGWQWACGCEREAGCH